MDLGLRNGSCSSPVAAEAADRRSGGRSPRKERSSPSTTGAGDGPARPGPKRQRRRSSRRVAGRSRVSAISARRMQISADGRAGRGAEVGAGRRARDGHLDLQVGEVHRDRRRCPGMSVMADPARRDVPCLSRGRARDAGGRLGPHREHRRARSGKLVKASSAPPTTLRRRPAIVALSASLAKELGLTGILVNAVAPTKILTDEGRCAIHSPTSVRRRWRRRSRVRRLATPEDLASLVVWLGSGRQHLCRRARRSR